MLLNTGSLLTAEDIRQMRKAQGGESVRLDPTQTEQLIRTLEEYKRAYARCACKYSDA